MRPRTALNSLGRPANVQEAVQSHRTTHGRGTSKFVAATFGVSVRTAQRWLAGTQTPRNAAAVMAQADVRYVRSNALRNAQGANVGSVQVVSKSDGKPSGKRNVGEVFCDFGAVADALDAGASIDDAARLMSDVVLDAYGGHAGDHLFVADYGALDLF